MSGVGSLMLLDTASLYYRAFFGVPETVRAPDGTPVNAIRGLLDMISRLVRARHPARLVACLDADWRPAFRVAAVPSYKAHRLAADGLSEETPPALAPQVPLIEEILKVAGLAVAGAPGYEADDVMGTLAARSDVPVDVVTGDRDLFQLVDDARGVRVIYTVRGLMNMDVIDEAAVTAKYDIPGRAYADFAALRGDPSDGLPGVPGVGEKTAAALIRTFGSVEGDHHGAGRRPRRVSPRRPGQAREGPGVPGRGPVRGQGGRRRAAAGPRRDAARGACRRRPAARARRPVGPRVLAGPVRQRRVAVLASMS